MTSELPTTTTEITPEWLTGALRDSGTIGGDVSVSSIEARDTGSGVGFMGEVGIVDVVYDGDAGDAPGVIVAKFPTSSTDVREMMYPTRVYQREHSFYRDLAEQTPVRTPAHYHITCDVSDDPHAERYLMLMEDFSHLTIGDQLAGVGPEQARAALVGLAAHHARFWNAAGLEDADYIPVIDGPLNQAGQQIYAASYPGFIEVFGDVLDPRISTFAERYGDIRPAILDRLARMPHTLVHFDYRADNLFFDDDGSVVVIDWQAISEGGGAADVGYFLSQNLSVADRRAHEDELLRAYHDALVANGVTDYAYDDLVVDYDIGILCGWIIPAFAVGSLDVSSERAMALWNEVVDRVQTAILDRGLHEWQP